MKIDFESIPEVEMPNFKGGEKSAHIKTYNDGKNKIMRIRLTPGASIGLHTHKGNSEIIRILEGNGTVIDDGKTYPTTENDVLYCAEDHEHSMINNGDNDLIFFAIVPEHRL